ncbi:protein mono-ADP-ribosyltransferase PARP14 isoform X1 [Phoca vitulina]|uniref:protein mono-ADP-ribosyltransferase PARP14 isoform X1 n=2 Tax=Phoca vitulina TaxID=9720 RepID=UPI001396546F|nr:protein mono-ADP-ribosyltransferase PARP14 isoform X1 [Phoca vitulina]
MAALGSFPLLVEGSWGPDPPKNLSTKLQMYFQSSRRSGGGDCEIRQKPGTPSRFLVFFHLENVRQKVLETKKHELLWPGIGAFQLTVQLPTAPDEVQDVFEGEIPTKELETKEHVKEPDVSEELDTKLTPSRRSEKMEDTSEECENTASSVAFENLKTNVTDIMLILIVENITGLSNDAFQVEVLQDFDVAVVTFLTHVDAVKFVNDCPRHHLVKQLQLSPRLLEVTKTIRVENLPPGVDDYNLKCLFENPQNGGGRIASIECLPEENSALIEFFDKKVLHTIMTKKLDLNNMPLSVFPYYTSLGTALYGKEKPLIKLPAPFRESLDLPLWKFLQKKKHLIDEINDEARHCHCDLIWSKLSSEVIIRPATTLICLGRLRIRRWKEDVSTAFSSIRSKYKVTPFKVDPIVWDTIKKSVEDDRILIEFDTLTGIVTLVGKSEDVQNIEPQIKELIESTTQKIKREEQSLKEKVAISPGRYSLLCHSDVLERLHTECPEMEICYDEASQHMCFKGLYTDVYKAKYEIQKKMYTMVQKSIQLPPEIFQFLQKGDCIEFSKSLLMAQKILAVYELEGKTVLLIGYSSEVLLDAEKQMVSALSYKRINIEDREVLNGKKWKGLTHSLHKRHNSSSKTVIIDELTSKTKAEVIIAGCVREVNESYSLLFDFVEKHTKIERFIEIEPPVIIDYLRIEKKPFWQKIKTTNVQVTFNLENKQKGILLTGPRAKVLEGVSIVKQALDSVCIESVRIDKPLVSQFFQEKAQYYKREVKRLFGCSIDLQENGGEKEGGSTDGQKCLSQVELAPRVSLKGPQSNLPQVELAPGVSLMVQQGDLTQFPVEVVVSSASEDLQLCSSLAAALSKAAGPELQQDCDQIVKKMGKILPGSAIISKAGKLPYRHVVLAVGPRWKDDEDLKCMFQLKRAVEESLRLAETHRCRSIAIPAISSGAGGFPLAQCVKTIVMAIKKNFQFKQDGHTLKEIYLVDTAEKTVQAFAETVKTVFEDPPPPMASGPSVPQTVQPVLTNVRGHRQIPLSQGSLRILLVKGDVQSATADVLVNSIPVNLQLNKGLLSQALLAKAGPKLQEELDRVGQAKAVGMGTVLQTSGHGLHCHHVLHVVAPDWRDGCTSSHKIMRDIIRKCLEITENLFLRSIAFPAIGTGNLGFPKTIFAELIISEVLNFSSKIQLTALQEVQFLLHPSDHENIQAFSDEFARRTNGSFVSDKILKAEDAQDFHGTASSPNVDVHEMKIGPIIFQVAFGDITKEKADVIVNSTSKAFNLKAGVSKAILECAGQNVEMACSRLAQKGNSDYIVTEGGLLRCKNIVHIIGGNDVKKSVSLVLQECEKRNYSSICLPAIGTGNAQKDPGTVADAIIEAIEDFTQKGMLQSVKKVKVVIFLPHLLDVFCDSMKKREASLASPRPSLKSKLTPFVGSPSQSPEKQNPLVLKKKTESASFQVCGESVKCIENVVSWIQDLITKELCPYINEDDCIKDFNEKEYQKLNELQENLNIAICLDCKRPLIEVFGIGKDLTQARNAIEEMIKGMRLAKEQKSQAEFISEFIEWQYFKNRTFHSFDKITNLQLENARKAKKSRTVVKINHQSYTVDLTTHTATDAKGQSLPVQRLMKPEVKIPEHWSDMKQQEVCVVELQPGHAEYNTVASKFNQTCSHFYIKKIERIQNLNLWNCYQTKKKTMDAKNGHKDNEKQLFHGTDADSVPHVNQNGFNRSYAGKNAVAYGKGTYFAVNACYSANDTYSRPDRHGRKHMYYVRVLTGTYTHGNSSLIVPPPKSPENPTDLYDTVTDSVQNPHLFVVFYDYQAYPEYLITFTN